MMIGSIVGRRRSGRFLSRDTLENAEKTQGPNLYKYAYDNPAKVTDPTGNATLILEEDGNPVKNYDNDKMRNTAQITVAWTITHKGSVVNRGAASAVKSAIVAGAASYGWATSRYGNIGGTVSWNLVDSNGKSNCWAVSATVVDAIGIDDAGQSALSLQQKQGKIPSSVSISQNAVDGLNSGNQ